MHTSATLSLGDAGGWKAADKIRTSNLETGHARQFRINFLWGIFPLLHINLMRSRWVQFPRYNSQFEWKVDAVESLPRQVLPFGIMFPDILVSMRAVLFSSTLHPLERAASF